MSNHNDILPVMDTIKTAWSDSNSGAKGTVWACIGIVILVSAAFGVIAKLNETILPNLNFVVSLISQVILSLLFTGIYYIGIRRAARASITYSQVFYTLEFDMALRLIGLYVLYLLALTPGILVAFICGFFAGAWFNGDMQLGSVITLSIGCLLVVAYMIYINISLILSRGLVLMTRCNPWHAIVQSFRQTQPYFWNLLGIYIVQVCILLLCCIPLGIGLIWGIPFIYVLYGTIYTRLTSSV